MHCSVPDIDLHIWWLFTEAMHLSFVFKLCCAAGVVLTAISAGDDHTCALASGGSLWCWGNNRNGQLGINSTVPQQTGPVVVSLGAGVHENEWGLLQWGSILLISTRIFFNYSSILSSYKMMIERSSEFYGWRIIHTHASSKTFLSKYDAYK